MGAFGFRVTVCMIDGLLYFLNQELAIITWYMNTKETKKRNNNKKENKSNQI